MNTFLNLSPTLQKAFYYDGNAVYHRRGKNLKLLDKLADGRLYVTYQGTRIYAKDLAWALHFGNWPMFPLLIADGQPFNLAIENLLPMRGRRFRLRINGHDGKFKHSLSKELFATRKAAEKSWGENMTRKLRLDRQFCLDYEATARGDVPIEHHEIEILPEPDLPPVIPHWLDAKPRKLPENARAHKMGARWIVVPAPKGIWDDWHLRVAAAIQILELDAIPGQS